MRGTVTKRRDRWYICYYIGKDATTGKWKQKWEGSWPTKREAEKVLRSRIEEQENTFERKADNSTLAVYLRYWLDSYCASQLAPNTLRGYRVNVENHIIPKIGNIQLNRLQPKDIQSLYDTLRKAGLSGTTIRYVHNNLHKALRAAVKAQLITRNPADLVDPPKKDLYEASPLTPAQSVALVRACTGKEIFLPVLLALTLGLRRGEALGLQWKNVDLSANTVTISHSATFSKGGFSLSSTKTKNSRRTLMMPEILQSALVAAHSKQAEDAEAFGPGFNPHDLVCCRPDGSPLTSSALQRQFSAALEEAHLPSIRFHDLRHTNATLMLRNSVPAKIVSAMLGHSSIGITLDVYSHVMTEMQEGAVEVVDALFKKPC